MLAQQRDEGKARTLAHSIAMRATRHERGSDEEADLRMDLAAIAGDAEELEKALGATLDAPLGRAGREQVVFFAEEPAPEVGAGCGGPGLIDLMEKAVEAKERAAEEADEEERFESLVHLAISAWSVYGSRKPFVFNADVYLVGKACMEQLGKDLAVYGDLLQKHLARRKAQPHEKRSKG